MAKYIRIIPWLDEKLLNNQLAKLGKRQEKVKIDIDGSGINKAYQGMNQLHGSAKNVNTVFGKLKNILKDTFSHGHMAMTTYLFALNEIRKAGNQAKDTIVDLDKAVTDLSIAMGGSRQEAYAYLGTLNKQAKELKVTTDVVAKASDDWLRSGKSIAETNTLVRDSTILSVLGQIDSADATKYLTSTLNGYQLATEDAIKTVDKLTKVDGMSASSAGSLAEAISKTASAAKMAGVELDTLIGYAAAIEDVTKADGSEIGNALKGIFSRFNNIKLQKFEDDQSGEALNDVEKTLEAVGIKMRDTNGVFLENQVIIDQLGKRWNKFDSVQQRAIATAAAGTHRYNQFLALMQNYDKALQYTEASLNSTGNAIEKYEKSYVDSLQAKTAELQASFESLVLNQAFEDAYGDILDATRGLIDFLNATNAVKGALTALTLTGVIKGFTLLKSGIVEAYTNLNQFKQALDISKQANIGTMAFDRLLLLTKNLGNSQLKLIMSSKSLSVTQKELLLVNSGLSLEESKLALNTWGVTKAQTGLIASSVSLKAAMSSLWTLIASNPLMIAVAGISAATMAWNSYKQKLEEVRQATKDSANAYKESVSSINDYLSKYEELNSALQKAGDNEEESRAIKEQLLSLQNELNSACGSEYEAVNLLTGAYEDNLAILKAYNAEKAKAFLNENVEGIKDATKQMTKERHYNLSTMMYGGAEDAEAIREVANKYTDSGLYLNEAMDGTFTVHIKADAQTAQDTIDSFMNDLRDKAKELGNEELFSETIAFSSKELNRAKEVVKEFGNTYRQALQAEIVSDADKTKIYNEAIDKVEKYNEAVLNSEDPYNDEKVKSARSNIEELKNDIDNNASAWEKYSSIIDDVFSKMEKIENIESNITPDIPANNPEIISSLSISQTVDQLNTQLKPTIDSLADAYNNIFTADGFTRENIGLDMFSSIREELDNLQKSLEESGSSAVVDYSAYEKLVSVLNDAESTAIQIKDAFDEVALSVANVSITGLEDFQVLKESLEQLGYVDADLVAFEALVSNIEALKSAGLDLADTSLTESDFISFVDSLGISAEYATQAVDMLTFAQQLNKANSLDTSTSVASLLQLATDAGYTGEIIQWLTQLMKIYNYLEQDTLKDPQTVQDYIAEAEMLTNKIKESAGKINVAPKVDKTDWKPLQKSASKAGKDAGKSYKEALEEELSNLGDVISYVGDIIGDQIDLWEDQKDAAVDSLNAQKEAAEDALEAQIDLVEEQIEAIENQIELKEKEIEKIQDARKERDLELASQKALADWNRRLSQKNRFIYKEGNDGVPGQMVYEHDIKGIRDAKEEYDRTQEDLEINRIEKEIKILEEEISGLEDIIDGLNEQIEASNKYYDDLISQTEKYYDSMIQGLEDYKSRWEELANIEKEAKMQVALKNLGIETTDILNMSEEAFNSFKNQYLSILTQMYNGETDMINAINSVAQGLDTTTLETGLIKTKENIDKLNNADFTSVKTGLDSVSTGMDSVGNSASTASTNTSAVSDDLQKMNQSTEGLDTKLSGVATALDSIPTRDKFDGLTEACSSLGEAIERISKALGVSDGSVSGLVTALQEISTISLMGEDGKGGIISQFQSLKTAVDEVTSAINGGGAMNVEGGGLSTGASGGSAQPQGNEGGAGGLTGAIKEIGTTTDETMGAGSSESGEGSASSEGGEGDGVLGKFSAFKDSVDAVTKAIGTGEEETGSEEGASTLIGALQLHYEKAEETLPQVKSRFEELLESISACVEKLSELAGAMSSLGGGGGNSFSLFAKGTDPNTSFSGMVGKAFAKGTGRFKGLSKDEPLAITSEYGQPETIIPPDGNAMITTSPTAMSLKKGTVILNEEQTKEMLNNEPKPVYRELGKKTFELGVDYDIVDGRPKFKTYLNPDDYANRTDYFDAMMSRFNFSNTFESSKEAFTKPLYSIEDKLEKMTEQISNVNNNYNNQSVSFGDIHVHCSGITSEEVGREAGVKFYEELNRATIGLPNAARQRNTTIGKVY